MNATQVSDLIKQGLLALGVSSTVIGYFSDQVWVAIGGVVLAVGAAVWQFLMRSTPKLIDAVAAEPEVHKVVVSPELVFSSNSAKVVAKEPKL
jgi:hypothetical protein